MELVKVQSVDGVLMAEIADHGQQLDLRTRRGADFSVLLTLLDAPGGSPIDLTGATVVSRIFAPGSPDVVFQYSVDGPAGQITLTVNAATTRNMLQNWQYTAGYKLAGQTHPLLFGQFLVSQESL